MFARFCKHILLCSLHRTVWKLPEQTQAHMILKSKKYEVPDAEKKDVYNILQQAHTCTYSDSYPSNMANQSDVLRSLSAPLRSASSKGQASKDGMPDLRPKRCCKRKGVATRAKRLSSQHDEAGGASNTLDYTSHLMFTEFLGCTILVQEKFTCAILYYLYIYIYLYLFVIENKYHRTPHANTFSHCFLLQVGQTEHGHSTLLTRCNSTFLQSASSPEQEMCSEFSIYGGRVMTPLDANEELRRCSSANLERGKMITQVCNQHQTKTIPRLRSLQSLYFQLFVWVRAWPIMVGKQLWYWLGLFGSFQVFSIMCRSKSEVV